VTHPNTPMSRLIQRGGMLRGPFGHMRRNAVAYLALFVALGGTSAYAANEWTGANIVDESLTAADIKNGSLGAADITNESLTSADIKNYNAAGGGLGNGDLLTGSVDSRAATDNSLTSTDIKNLSLGNGDFLTGSVDTRATTDNSLTGTDINESTLNMPPTTTATFASPSAPVPLRDSFTKVAGKTLPAGSYAIAATANALSGWDGSDHVSDTACELRNGTSFIGGATDRRVIKSFDDVKVSLSMNGGAQVPAGGGEVSLWCLSQFGRRVDYGQMMIIRVDGFF
jgi:hypothetical protein